MKRRLVSMCLAVMLVGGLSLTSMHEVKAAENKVIDGSELTHDNYQRCRFNGRIFEVYKA